MKIKTIFVSLIPLFISACSLSLGSSSERSIDNYGDEKPSDLCSQLGSYDECLVRRCFSEYSATEDYNEEIANSIYDIYLLSENGNQKTTNIYSDNIFINPQFKIEGNKTTIYSNGYVMEVKDREDKILLTKNDKIIHSMCYETFIKNNKKLL